MKRLPFYFWASLALASCQGGKEAVNQALPVIDMNEDYPEKEIVLQDIADISYIPLETNDEFLFAGFTSIEPISLYSPGPLPTLWMRLSAFPCRLKKQTSFPRCPLVITY